MSRAETIAKKVDEKIKRTLELQSKGLSKDEIAEAMETTPIALSKFMKRYGYKSQNNVFKVDDKPKVTKCKTNVKQDKAEPKAEKKECKTDVKQDVIQDKKEQKKECKTSVKQNVIQMEQMDKDNKCKTNVKQEEQSQVPEVYNKCKTSVIQVEQMDTNEKIYEVLSMVENLKYLSNNIQKIKNIIEVEKEEFITLTVDRTEDAEQSNYRVYSSVRRDFKKFCEQHKEYKVQELISQALKDFMDKYQ